MNEWQDSRFENFNKKNIRIQFVTRTGNASSTLYTHPGSFATPLVSLCNDYDKRRSSDSCCGLDLLSFDTKERKTLCFRRRTAAAADGAGMEE